MGAVTRTNLTILGTVGGMSVTVTSVTAARYSCDEGDSGQCLKKQIMDSPAFIFRSSSDSITFH